MASDISQATIMALDKLYDRCPSCNPKGMFIDGGGNPRFGNYVILPEPFSDIACGAIERWIMSVPNMMFSWKLIVGGQYRLMVVDSTKWGEGTVIAQEYADSMLEALIAAANLLIDATTKGATDGE